MCIFIYAKMVKAMETEQYLLKSVEEIDGYRIMWNCNYNTTTGKHS